LPATASAWPASIPRSCASSRPPAPRCRSSWWRGCARTTGDSAQPDDLQDRFGTFTADFAAGFSELVLLVYTNADTTPEPFETFTVTLTGTDVGGLGGNLSNEYTIANDDLGPPPLLGPVFYFSGFNAERGRELANHTLGSVDHVGSRLVFTARDQSLFQNTNGSGDDDIWTLYSAEAGPLVLALPLRGVLPRQDGLFGNQSPVRGLDEVGTAFLGDDDRVFWLQQNDQFGRGLEIHSLDFATNVITWQELVPGAASGVVGAGDAIFANGRLHFVGTTNAAVEGPALWTLAADLTVSKVAGPNLPATFSLPGELTEVNGEVFFAAQDQTTGFRRLFQMNDDGVTAELLALPGANPNLFFLEALGPELGFVGSDASGLRQLFRFTPGSQPGLEGPVEQLTSFAGPSDFLGDPTLGGDGRIYFVRSVQAFGCELWVVDAAEAEGARLLDDVNLDPVPVGYEPGQVVAQPFIL
jgi:hypothetical protein